MSFHIHVLHGRPRWLSWMRVQLVIRRLRVRPSPGRQHSFGEIDHEIFSTVILSLPLIQEQKLSVSGGRMCTILFNLFLGDYACPVIVWLGKLTALDTAVKPQHKQTFTYSYSVTNVNPILVIIGLQYRSEHIYSQ